MPELPEVETIRRSLQTLIGRRCKNLWLSDLAPVETTRPLQLRQRLEGRTVAAIERRGKYLLLTVDGGASLVIHLGMSGRLLFRQRPTLPHAKHTHMVITFEDQGELSLTDARRFSTFSLADDPSGRGNLFLQRLGPDALDPSLTPEQFCERARRHPGLSLKNLLLNQSVIAGLGNIYACEALYTAALSPKRRVRRTNTAELQGLFRAIGIILQRGIQHGGTTLRDYIDGRGNRGKMKDFLQVYGRDGMTTLDGRGRVKRIVQTQRSTWFSPEVQR